ncbi:di-trans,poly-cis-decaprenylcistransferase [Helicobacter sp. MIT 05-5294]|uniref:di-trans,poly-cis-decaprenylcistransferase n=1 Tax=Helicobacter sp. MIT 05-5294 TaxID=1548150 RepID=UPI00051F91FA|nr:di-trans,poly-cis-decaprenylcistransferase [Helicobacter sp. MIT 05-5294]TLD88139.1 di-trans,poly-cis-decaprenylcistransferase [Helicobacter sp. MIT 05-5294]
MLRHLALIMDGNGRWAKQRLKPRIFGHKEGAKKLREITEFCAKSGIQYLSLYAFSTENWKRPKAEVEYLMNLLGEYLIREKTTYLRSNIIFKSIGDISALSEELQQKIQSLEAQTQEQCNGMTQILALNYGAKDELRRAFVRLMEGGIAPNEPNQLSEQDISCALDTSKIPEVDMLVRTGGEMRLSNFLLWQSAYAELFFTQTLWPSFSVEELEAMMVEFHQRERRFGGL